MISEVASAGGLVTGGPGRLVVLGVAGDEGRSSLQALERTREPLPLTLTSATGGGGEQRLFAVPDELDLDAIGDSVRKLGPGSTSAHRAARSSSRRRCTEAAAATLGGVRGGGANAELSPRAP